MPENLFFLPLICVQFDEYRITAENCTLKSKTFLNTTRGGAIIGESKISAPYFSAKSNSLISEEQCDSFLFRLKKVFNCRFHIINNGVCVIIDRPMR